LAFDGSTVRLGCPAAKVFYVETAHASIVT
jgi:hypothetical protein